MNFKEETTYIMVSVSPNNKYVMVHPKNAADKIQVITKNEFDSVYYLVEGVEYKKRG